LRQNCISVNRERGNECFVPLEISRRTSVLCGDFVVRDLAIAFVHNCQLVDKLALGNFKGLSQMGDRQILQKISAHLILMKTISNDLT
jgi:hypothetical protein